MIITAAHGAGGQIMSELIRDIFARRFANRTLSQMEDAAVLRLPTRKIAFTTDSFVVSPLFFPGGDIGRMSVCGTVNDLSMRGAVPKYLSAGFILEEGLDIELLERVAVSMRAAADEAGVRIVAGDTKVIEGSGGMYINTSGIGAIHTKRDIGAHNAVPGDAVIISGTLGSHHACILSARMNISNEIRSDCAPINEMTRALLRAGLSVHAMRDITRGGLATALHEIAEASGVRIILDGGVDYADEPVRGFCEILGLDPLYMGNEGKLALILPHSEAREAVRVIRSCRYGESAMIVGQVRSGGEPGVVIQTRAGGTRRLGPLQGEGLPRIC